MILVVTTEKGGLDRYSQELSKRLPVRTIRTRRYLGFKGNLGLLRTLRSVKEPLHLPNQHFGRFSFFLRVPFIITVHDLARFIFREEGGNFKERMGLLFDRMGIKRASFIIAVSENTKRDMVRLWGIPEERIEVIYNGIDRDVFKPCGKDSSPYILYVGSERPRKNLPRLLEAFREVKRFYPELKLVKVGREGRSPRFREMTVRKIRELGLEGDVIFTGDVDDGRLAKLYSEALLLVYPSLYEGFGLPPLEAMACGCPVCASNSSSIPEVVGDAGILFDPYSVEDMTRAILKVLSDNSLRRSLIERGFERASLFTWERTAEKTLELYGRIS